MKFTKRGWVLSAIAILVVCSLLLMPKVQVDITMGEKKSTLTIGFAGEVYAAPPDYTVDGVDDHVQVQQALNDLPSTGGKIILYACNYSFGATVSRTINNVTFEGSGKATYLAWDGSTALISAGSQAGWIFKDIRTDAGWLTLAGDTIVDNCWNAGTLTYVGGDSHSNRSTLDATQESFTTALKTSYDWLVTNITSAWKTTVDNFIASKGAASGLASLDSSSKVVQDPANATATAAASKIPISDADTFIGQAWLGSGASSSNFLRGDQTWAATPTAAPSPPTGRTQVTLQNDFIGTAAADINPFTAAAVSSGTVAFQAGQAGHPGIIRYTSSTTANSGYKHVGSQITAVLIGGGETAELIIKTPAAFTNTTIRFGYLDTATYADAVDGVYFEVPATGAAVGKTSSNSTRGTTATSYTVSASTWYRLKLVVNDAATSVTYYIYNNSGTQLWTNSLAANIPTATGRETGFGIIATNSGTTATALMDLDAMLFYNVKENR